MRSLIQKKVIRVFEVMHMEKVVAEVATNGKVKLFGDWEKEAEMFERRLAELKIKCR